MILVSYSKTYILLCRYGYMPTGFDILEYDKSLQRYWLVRLVAAVIDSIIISLISFLVVIFFTRDVWINSFFFGIIWLLYSTVFEGIEGYTLGKKLMKLKVVTHVGNLDFQTSLVRNLSKIWGIFLIVDFIVGLATEGDPRQRYLDRLTDTLVIEIPNKRKQLGVKQVTIPSEEKEEGTDDEYIIPKV